MAGLFDAVNLAKRSLMAQQWALTTASHNMSNVNTPGFTRQRAVLEAFKEPLEIPGGLIGMGSDVGEITRLRNRYLDRQVLDERQNQGFLEFENTALSQVETILGETSGYGLSGVLDEFWSCWSDVANEPENTAVRVALQQKGEQVAQNLNNLYSDLITQQKELDQQLSGYVNEINMKAAQIASLNDTIAQQVSQGFSPNDLMDQRDLLIDGLAKIANIEMQDESNGSTSIWLGGQILVYKDSAQQLSLKERTDSLAKVHDVVWAGSGNSVNLQSGEAAALLFVRDEVIPELMSGLDQFAVALSSQLNALHSTGYGLDGSTGNNFFNPDTTGAADIALSLEVSQDVAKIAVSADGSVGNSDIANQIYDLQNELVMNQNTATLGGFYASLATDVGALKQTAEMELMESDVSMQQLENWQTSAEGVSLDEEMANLVRYQQVYTAMAKFLNTVDEMLGVLINIG
ncbi:flagellar hook-associated protein FlgK [candidate division LCP-89 bacterium B3_LCP]|uniref:Flagellar hook-associated protein 1 n=1 Tax=candidate division LCP-89 bacterium B3_LCP TaxID=2012998 RepID=A0A532UZA2_UNCL8|nr:MAG: flagellar hook-associated protein FlgK [candidate division LCP-89 bacterium B3_LCP]